MWAYPGQSPAHKKLYLISTCIFLVLFIGVYPAGRIIDIRVCLAILSIRFPINPDEYSFARHKKVYIRSVKQGVVLSHGTRRHGC